MRLSCPHRDDEHDGSVSRRVAGGKPLQRAASADPHPECRRSDADFRRLGSATNPCPMYPQPSPALLYAATVGSIPYRLNLHVGDVGHVLSFGPIGKGKSTLLATVSMQALRYLGHADMGL